jgi:hypothetical protein
MTRVERYLLVPAAYCEELGGLCWSATEDALEHPDGATFALAVEVVAFLEGLASQRPLVHFGFVLHLLRLLRHGRTRVPRHDFGRLVRAYQEAGRPARTAGALAALLCRDVPAAPDPPSAEELGLWLTIHSFTTGDVDAREWAQEPPLDHEVFEAHVACALDELSDEELAHWMRYGQAPPGDAAEQAARALLAERPRSLEGALDDLARHDRLAGAVPFVAQLVGALALPPRRLSAPELPLGGYADVTTRGHPEQVLLSQLALDDLEFLRRHAENELLYYRREEPHARAREELVVLLDQGVRTWGIVRLVLAAAVLALGRLAQRRRLSFLVAATSGGGAPVSPLEVGEDELAERVGASDLSPQPGLALERVLEACGEGPRDVVLLTHPRNLAEPDVAAAALRAGRHTRLFALAVDGHGDAALSELRHGAPLPLARFHIDLDRPAPAHPTDAPAAWRGDVEPVGFPFRFGVDWHPQTFPFALDDAGEWLLIVSRRGMLHATRTDGAGTEVLPRGLIDGEVLDGPNEVLGVTGGFVVAGQLGGRKVAFHYDFRARTVRAHAFPVGGHGWCYLRRRHALINFHDPDDYQSVCLSSGRRDVIAGPLWAAPLVRPEFPGGLNVRYLPTPDDWVPGAAEPPPCPWLRFTPDTGTITLGGLSPAWPALTPREDGGLALRGHRLLRGEYRGGTLAALFGAPGGEKSLWLFRLPDGGPPTSYALDKVWGSFRLCADGKLVAFRHAATGQIEVRDVAPGLTRRAVTPAGRFHNNVTVVGDEGWLSLHCGARCLLLRWDQGALAHQFFPGDGLASVMAELCRAPVGSASTASMPVITHGTHKPSSWPAFLSYDAQRFRGVAQNNLVVAVDLFGQVFLFEHSGELVCAFFAFRRSFAAWMPDGTCLGPPALLGGPETPGAAEKIGRALREAEARGEGRAP